MPVYAPGALFSVVYVPCAQARASSTSPPSKPRCAADSNLCVRKDLKLTSAPETSTIGSSWPQPDTLRKRCRGGARDHPFITQRFREACRAEGPTYRDVAWTITSPRVVDGTKSSTAIPEGDFWRTLNRKRGRPAALNKERRSKESGRDARASDIPTESLRVQCVEINQPQPEDTS